VALGVAAAGAPFLTRAGETNPQYAFDGFTIVDPRRGRRHGWNERPTAFGANESIGVTRK